MQEIITKICNDKNCKYFGNPQPLENFYLTKRGYQSKCKCCTNKRNILSYNCNKEKRLKKMRENYTLDKTKKIEYRKKNKDKHKKYMQEYRINNKDKYKLWGNENRDKLRFYSSRRRTGIKQATPKWLTEHQICEIKNIYKKCVNIEKKTQIKYHVDHIIPLITKDENGNHIACGLHVPWNLQIIPASENCKKSCYLKNFG